MGGLGTIISNGGQQDVNNYFRIVEQEDGSSPTVGDIVSFSGSGGTFTIGALYAYTNVNATSVSVGAKQATPFATGSISSGNLGTITISSFGSYPSTGTPGLTIYVMNTPIGLGTPTYAATPYSRAATGINCAVIYKDDGSLFGADFIGGSGGVAIE